MERNPKAGEEAAIVPLRVVNERVDVRRSGGATIRRRLRKDPRDVRAQRSQKETTRMIGLGYEKRSPDLR